MSRNLHRSGVTLPEIVITLVLVGILTAIAAPALYRWVALSHVHAALNQVSAELSRARMLAVERGSRVSTVLHSADGCMVAIRTFAPADPQNPPVRISLDTSAVCLRHSGDSILTFNSRGMLLPPARSVYSADAAFADSLLMSSAGRIRRNY